MKIAHLILVHKDPAQLARLLDKLSHPDADIYVHIDRKTPVEEFVKVCKRPNVYMIKNRIKVHWGSYSIVQATLNGFKQILSAKKGYGYINLLSVSDYPIKSTAEIHDFFNKHPDKIWMEYLTEESDWWQKIKTRVTKYHLTDYNFKGSYTLSTLLNKFFPDRTAPDNLEFVGRSQWLTVTEEAARYVIYYLQENPKVEKFFKLTWGADEVIIQTILYNSHLKDKIVNNNLRYTDWSEDKDSPKVLTMADAPKLRISPHLFARKFDMAIDKEILDFLDTVTASKPAAK
ncbi:glycosyl transferase [Mucilaginibacter sp. PPCGB 2223]|uniref:beta-1,6-N-acetylglucosaminyltransferase n=1 Tax=Mucilaginibacter sp. PPCGB 2223 TaxID=1886027 RepID=UPI0008246372|nr:beta-1,6-N-acetylglucosaminyltransferase [Mucilaginibacter sp. PPCGB 2223]OCX51586.1 glycosyl transferase [Mucilaginibacter sp. PPCGB 2223]